MDRSLSIVVPLYNEETVIEKMYERLIEIMNKNNFSFEIIFVNDGSEDNTLKIAKKICAKDNRVKLISFSRNFGHQIAITAGMDKCSGQGVVIIDADLQDPPEIIVEMVKKWNDGYHVIYGKRTERKGETAIKLFTASAFYKTLKLLTAVDIPVNTGDFRLMDRSVVRELQKMKERSRFIRGMVSWVGFRQCAVTYVREERYAGKTKYPFKKMFKFAIDGILSFSQIPLKLSSAFGILCSCVSFLFIFYGLIIKIFYPTRAITGWASTFVAILFIGGVQLICIGIVGEYLGRIYEEIKQRPMYIIEEEINF